MVYKRETLLVASDLYANKLKWRVNAKMVDIGFGDRGTTVNISKKYLPPNFSNLTGCDKSKKTDRFHERTL